LENNNAFVKQIFYALLAELVLYRNPFTKKIPC
jgi:hypothetical protein